MEEYSVSRVHRVKKTPIPFAGLEANPKIVDDSGYIPLNVLIARFERSGELKEMYQRLTNPNTSLDKVIEDFSQLEQFGDSLEVMAFAKASMDRIRKTNPAACESIIPSGRAGTSELADSLLAEL